MGLIKLKQVAGGAELRSELDALKSTVEELDSSSNVTQNDIDNAVGVETSRATEVEEALDSRLTDVEGAITNPPKTIRTFESMDLTEDPNNVVNLMNTPNASKVHMYVNRVPYFEDIDFSVDRAGKTVTWLFTPENGGLDLSIGDLIVFEYSVDPA
jgi:tetrahydromethanopterin S-methyltransferase subunit F